MTYKVCIIVPVYNVEKYIERCARSLFQQTFDDIQYVFVDDCTPDHSTEILKQIIKEYPIREKHTTIIKHNENKGIGTTRASGLSVVNADYILYVDSDDCIELNTIELIYNKAIKENADIVVCEFLKDWGNVSKIDAQSYSADNKEYTKMLLSGRVLPGVINKLIKSSLYFEHKINFFQGIDMGEDFSVTPRLAYFANKISKVELPLYIYNQKNTNAYTKTYSYTAAISLMKAIEVLQNFFMSVPDYNDYFDSLLEGKLRKKILLLMELSSDDRRKIGLIYPETNRIISNTKLTLPEKIAILFCNKGWYSLLDLFLILYKNLLEFIQILKGRRK